MVEEGYILEEKKRPTYPGTINSLSIFCGFYIKLVFQRSRPSLWPEKSNKRHYIDIYMVSIVVS